MVAPFPLEARNAAALNQIATNIYGNYVWIARWSDEISTDAAINLKKLGQLAYGKASHCWMFAELTNNASPELVAAVQQRFAQGGIEWATRAAMRDDLLAIRAAALDLHSFVTANMPEAAELGRRVRDAEGIEVEQTSTIPKNGHAVLPKIAALRALYGPAPAQQGR